MIHKIYYLLGKTVCHICLIWWNIRDFLFPPKTDAVLFIAHPDDDTLFFHTFINQIKPYVCLMTDGWSLRRIPSFIKAMHLYGVKFRAYPLDSKDKRTKKLEKHVQRIMKIKKFLIIATHNSTGEYGHEEHIRVHNAVFQYAYNNHIHSVLCPVDNNRIQQFPLDQETVNEKNFIFSNIYTTESWVLNDDNAGTPIWVTHESLEEIQIP